MLDENDAKIVQSILDELNIVKNDLLEVNAKITQRHIDLIQDELSEWFNLKCNNEKENFKRENNLKKNQEWLIIDFKPLEHIGFGKKQINMIRAKRILTAQEVQASIYNFSDFLNEREMSQNHSIRYIMKVLLDGDFFDYYRGDK